MTRRTRIEALGLDGDVMALSKKGLGVRRIAAAISEKSGQSISYTAVQRYLTARAKAGGDAKAKAKADPEGEPSRLRPKSGKRTRTDAEARKARALPLLIAGVPYKDIAREVGVKACTVERWVREDSRFQHAIEAAAKASDEVLANARNQLHSAVPSAIATLVEAASSEWQAAVRLLNMVGVSAPTKVEHGVNPEQPDLLGKVADILAKRRGRS